jgi:acetylornithine deacetylase/succinyl-diaminopimelate desuccinylase-like protein
MTDLAARPLLDGITTEWSESILPSLHDFIRIPNVSPAYDSEWLSHGYMAEAVALVTAWCRERAERLPGASVEVVELPGLTPCILVEVPATQGCTNAGTVLLYGHVDKQPEMTGWREDLGPWKPYLDPATERLYGRGGSDDGYAVYAAVSAIEALHATGGEHARCVVLIEASEESGSPDLPAYVDALLPRLGTVDLVVCLDSGCGDYERLWTTTSLRGIAAGDLTVRVLDEGMHSGQGGGVVASSFRIARLLLERIEDAASGEIRLAALHTETPADRRSEVQGLTKLMPTVATDPVRFIAGSGPITDDPVEQVLNNTWRPTLAVVGAEGLPPLASAGNVLRPYTTLKLSVRLPPTVDPDAATKALKEALTADPPYGAKVTFDSEVGAPGWNAPSFAPWLVASLEAASMDFWGRPSASFGEGGSIPFMAMLGQRFPDAQYVVTGVGGPGSNAHGPNEFLDVPMARRITAAVARIMHDHATHEG